MTEPTHIPTDADWNDLVARITERARAEASKPGAPVVAAPVVPPVVLPPTADQMTAARNRLTQAGYTRTVCPKAFDALTAWFAERAAGTTKRGLWLFGPAGLGKTLFCATVLGLRPLTAVQIVDAHREYGGYDERFTERVYGSFTDTHVRIVPQPLVIDDLGQEPVSVLFGQREEVLGRVLCDRYEHWTRHGVRTYVTANQTPEQLDMRYGRRVTDRLAEMCVAVEFSGKSARQEA